MHVGHFLLHHISDLAMLAGPISWWCEIGSQTEAESYIVKAPFSHFVISE